ncbi:type II toxin-antitoxin system death-on-curing family toxin [Methylomonas sp. MO1]|uniref:type II toxin-antitoxin system death-on-curing family toxin n=1 Tax=Methylomonas sp. MO1 TaxID=3073619 RepID=UPI0028A36B34|nr:type II toxin-antitoxin system death-on-curing family toxin [Methylomonas sp. MO1]MDT4288899.1 type II toxin-antitoxin system death-on-curing family toxin [Methylomonas sp. MO1]
MPDLFYISKTLALTIHQQQIERFGGTQGIRDESLLESALGAAQQTWHYSGDIFQTAAQYCYSLANNHPFLDGNKRAAAACMLVFLAANHKQPAMDNIQLYEWVINVATRQLSRDELADLLKQYCK